MKKTLQTAIRTPALILMGLATLATARPYIVGADISWLLEDESVGATYWDGATQKDLFLILKDHGVNFIRVRTFVNPLGPRGYATNSVPGASAKVAWCDLEHTVILAKRIKAARMGFLLDFHMSDLWSSIGEQIVPAAWAGMSDAQMQKAAYDYVSSNVKELVRLGLRPDMVQVGNEINTKMSGVSISNQARFAGLINSGVKAVRDIDPKIKIVMQHGRPRPDGDFMGWYNIIKARVDYDFIGGSTYGTTNNGGDWREMFGNVVADGTPVMSLEYSGDRTSLINTVMNELPKQMGLGTFAWEPTRYGKPMFDHSGNKFTANSRLDDLQKLAKQYSATLPDFVQLDTKPTGISRMVDRQVSALASYSSSSRMVTVNASKARIQMYSANGENVLDVQLASAASTQQFGIPTNRLKTGLYILKVSSGQEVYSAPISIFPR